MFEIDETLREFLIESREGLDQVDQDLVALERAPGDRAILARVFRCIHTVKGTCGFLGFGHLEKVSHAGENLLGLLRDQKLTMHPDIATALLQLVDAMRRMLGAIEQTGADGTDDDSALIHELHRLADPQATAAPTSAAQPPPAAPVVAAPPPPAVVSAPEAAAVAPSAPAVAAPPPEDEGGSAAPAQVAAAAVEDTAIRVDVALLDKLMNLVGELVLARNQVLQFNQIVEDAAFVNTTQRLNLITSELQESVMKTRMQHIGHIWSRTPRLIRDLAHMSGKEIDLTMEGKDTELDKTLLEAIRDPLTHILRNAADHGLESPEDRVAAGKPRKGTIHMRAFHEGGQVNMEISDDGRGIDAEKVKRKAIEKGVITVDQAAYMSERDLINLIFAPGFSTKEQITNISGRGVGMDVVKTNIEKIGGTVDIRTEVGRGTTLRVKIPLTLAIIPALIVTQEGQRFAIPQVNLVELVRLEGAQARRDIRLLHSVPVHRLRGRLLPLVYLNRELKGISGPFTTEELFHNDAVDVVVLQADDRIFGLVVDDINDTVEIVVKPLGNLLKGLPMFAGATIMGDGRVALILDVLGLAQRAGLLGEGHERTGSESRAQITEQTRGQHITVILFQTPDDGRMAIPLADLERLEVVQVEDIEHTGALQLLQYRQHMLPLLDVAQLLPDKRARSRRAADEDAPQDVHLVIYRDGNQRVGIIVGRILDVMDADISTQIPAAREGVKFSAVLADRITEFLDLAWIVRRGARRTHPPAEAEAP